MPEITARLSTALADRYKIERHLGEGGMANVYLAHDLKHERKVALKIRKPNSPPSDSSFRRNSVHSG